MGSCYASADFLNYTASCSLLGLGFGDELSTANEPVSVKRPPAVKNASKGVVLAPLDIRGLSPGFRKVDANQSYSAP